MTTTEGPIRKVRALLAKAASTDSPQEADSLRNKANELRLRYGVSDEDLTMAEEIDEVEIFGVKMFLYSNKVRPRASRISSEVDAVLGVIASQDLQDAVGLFQQFRGDLKAIVDKIEAKRNAAIKALYAEKVAETVARWDNANEDDPYVHERAVSEIHYRIDMRRDQIERIVGRSSKSLYLKQLREQVCTICGLDGKDGRDMCGLFDVDSGREWMHAKCRPREEVAQ